MCVWGGGSQGLAASRGCGAGDRVGRVGVGGGVSQGMLSELPAHRKL